MIGISLDDMRRTEARLHKQLGEYTLADPRRNATIVQLQQYRWRRTNAETAIREQEEDMRLLALLGR